MEFNTVLDVSSFIWDREDYELNKHSYYYLQDRLGFFFEVMEREKPRVLLRDSLLNEMINGFPFDSVSRDFSELGNQIYKFLGNIGSNIISYSENITPNLYSIPNQIKGHFNDKTCNEINYLISNIHDNNEVNNIFFTFKYFIGDGNKLRTELNGETKEYETIISDENKELEEFFAKFKPIFEDNPKHVKTPYNSKEYWEELSDGDKKNIVSRLSCYNGNDTILPQELLDTGFKFEKCYYNYDNDNETWVIFRCHKDNIYHGYDEYDNNKIPNKVRKHFNK